MELFGGFGAWMLVRAAVSYLYLSPYHPRYVSIFFGTIRYSTRKNWNGNDHWETHVSGMSRAFIFWTHPYYSPWLPVQHRPNLLRSADITGIFPKRFFPRGSSCRPIKRPPGMGPDSLAARAFDTWSLWVVHLIEYDSWHKRLIDQESLWRVVSQKEVTVYI